MGGNLINLHGDFTTPTIDIKTDKLIFRSVLSTKNAKCMCSDIANFYLNNPKDRNRYIKLPLENFPDEIIQPYKIQDLAHKRFVYVEIQKGVYGLLQSGKNPNDKLKVHLEKIGYDTALIMLGLWQHQTRPLQFSLVVDNFGVKY